jgi:hypothetical protein
MVEMALLLPLLLLLIFGIIDFGWYIYGYATVYQAARNGSEAAAQLPPFEETLEDTVRRATDPCYGTIVNEVQEDSAMFDLTNSVNVNYPDEDYSPKRALGNPIEVEVTLDIRPLTPLFQMVPLGNNGVFTVASRSVRSIEALGNTPPTEEHPNGIVCR